MSSLTLKYDSRCADCGQKMFAGEEYSYAVDKNDNYIISHPGDCPAPKPDKRGQNVATWDQEVPFTHRKCSECGELWSFRNGTAIALRCPSSRISKGERVTCGGRWLRKDTDPDDGWAA